MKTETTESAGEVGGLSELLTEHETIVLSSVSRSSLRKLEAAGLFPRRRLIPGTRSIRWSRSEVLAFVRGVLHSAPGAGAGAGDTGGAA